MKLYLADIREVAPRHLALLSEQRARQAARYKMPDDKKRCIAGGLLLRRYVGEEGIYKNTWGKPVKEGICFNLSHSGDYVLLGVDGIDVGCDIEQIRSVNALRMGKIVFCENEMQQIENAPDRTEAFFRLWTKKEALLKCMGKGFHRQAKSVDVSGDTFTEDGVCYTMQTLVFADYVISCCSAGGRAQADLSLVHFDS